MIIYNTDGTSLTEAAITQDCKTVEEIGKSDYAELKWNSDVKLTLPVGSYFTVESKKYVLFDAYTPNETDSGFSYDVSFQAEWMILSRTPFILNTTDASGNAITETDWSITDKPVNILGYILTQIKTALPCATDALQWSVTMVGDLPASVSCTFDSVDIISALNTIVSSCNDEDTEAEWCINYETKTIYFGVCITVDDGDNVVLKVGDNVDKPSVSLNKDDYYNRFIVKGSTKNITQRSASGENVSTGVRLTLDPTKYPNGYIDTRTDTNEPILTKALIYDDIFPSLTLYVYDVRERQRYQLDDSTGDKVVDSYDTDGNPTYKKYSVWYIRLAYPTLDADGNATAWTDFKITDDMVVDGKTLTAAFEANEKGTHSALAGRDFEMTYHKTAITYPVNSNTGDTGATVKVGDYEIVFDKEDDLVIPTTSTLGLVPWGETTPNLLADTVVLYNIVMSSDYFAAAYVKLYNEAIKEINSEHSDKNSYTVPSNPVVFEDSTKNPNLYVGKAVTYNDGNGYTLATRVTKLVTNIDYPFVQEITVGNSKTKGSIETIKEDVEDASGKIETILSGSTDSSKAYYKALKTKLSKTSPDTAAEVITFVKGLIAQGKSYMQDVDFGTFVADSTGGAIYQKDGNWYFEGDFFHIRKKLTAESVEIQHTSHIGGKIIQSAADMVVYKVEEDDTSYKCYFLKKDSDGNIIYNKFKTLDQGLCETFNLTTSADGTAGNHYYWRLVTAVDDGTEDMCWIKLSKTDMADGSDAPLIGDKISQLGYRGTDSDKSSRTGANIQSGAGDAGSPYYRCYENITSYTLPSPSAQFSPNGSWITVTDSNGNSIAIQELLDSMQSTIATVKQQTDKQFDIWFVDEAPTLTNAPYTDWLATDTTNSNTEARDAHVDDLAYCDGKGYRFTVSNSVYAWADETDKDVLQALTNAANAQKTADEKIRCYVAQPSTDDVYDVGDQWVNATYPTGTDTITLDGVEYTADNPLYSNDSLVCITAKAKGTAFSIEHWQASSSTTAAALRVMKDGIVAVVTKNKTDTDTAIAAIENLTNTETSLYKNISANSTDITSVSKELATTEKSLATLSTNYSGTVTTLTSVSTVVNNITATAAADGTVITNISTSGIITTKNFIDLFTQHVTYDAAKSKLGITKSGLLTTDDSGNLYSEYVDSDGTQKSATISTIVRKTAAGVVESGITLAADQINFLGKTIINGNFVVDTDGNLTLKNITATGKIIATSGKIGNFTISSSRLGIDNVTYDSSGNATIGTTSGMSLYDDMIIFNETNRQSIIGTWNSLGVPILARLSDTVNDYVPHYGMLISIRNNYSDSVAMEIGGGCISGLRIKTYETNASETLTTAVNDVAVYGSDAVTLTLPIMQPYDDGFQITITNLRSIGVLIKPNIGYFYDSSSTLTQANTYMMVERGDAIPTTGSFGLPAICDCATFVYHKNLQNDDISSRGCWIMHKHPRDW